MHASFDKLCMQSMALQLHPAALCLRALTNGLHVVRTKYTRAFVRRLPFHRSLPIMFWLLVARLLRWKPPVPQVRNRVIRYKPCLRATPALDHGMLQPPQKTILMKCTWLMCRESNIEGLLGMYMTVLDAFKGEIACTLRVSSYAITDGFECRTPICCSEEVTPALSGCCGLTCSW